MNRLLSMFTGMAFLAVLSGCASNLMKEVGS